MEYLRRFEDYLRELTQRLGRLATARGVALLAAAAALISLIVVAIADHYGFPPGMFVAGRALLVATLAGIGFKFLLRPRRQVAADPAREIEARAPAFDGRVEAYATIRDGAHPLAELLAEDALAIAERHPPEAIAPDRSLRLAWLGAGTAIAALLLVAIAGPGNYAYGVRQLWVGWAFPGLLPAQAIVVRPGDGGIRLGGNLEIEAEPHGFTADEAMVHVRFAGGDFEAVSMGRQGDGFEFVFFSVRQPLEYYVTASHVRSPTYSIDVVDLPVIERLATTYRFPDWTRREPETRDPGGDVRAIAETRVEVRVKADRAMTPAALIVDDEEIALGVDGESAAGTFTVTGDGQYYVAAIVGGERIRLTDDYFITAEPDEPPAVEFARPGRDWSASRIEEVTAVVAADDDYGLEKLTLNYSVNGGDWRRVELATGVGETQAEHVFFLEALNDTPAESPLAPGDLIAYYAEAEDRNSAARTDMFFVDVQPFDRRYTQAQAGAMGGPQGGRDDEISARQREIIISTWNLIREQSEGRRGDDAYVVDNTALLARLQGTLRDQVETLARRSEARELTDSDPRIAQFVAELRQAATAMGPAADRLTAGDLEAALLPEQEALKHLLAAEAIFSDINVSLQAGNRGSGGQAGRDLTEMFELEMDLEKNQYETGSRASAEAPQRELAEAEAELAELARRQEQLAENRRRQQTPMPAERWRQEMLRRDVEELKERLERMAAAQTGDGQAQSGSSGARGESAGNPGDERFERELDELRRRLESATRAMHDADEAMRDGADESASRRAMDEAQRQLEAARDRASEVRQQALETDVADLAARAGDLHETQRGLEERLQDAVQRMLEAGDADPDLAESGMTLAEEFALANDKRKLLAQLEQLAQDARTAARDLAADRPRAADAIAEGVATIEEQQVEARLAVAAAYIEQGQGVYVASSESAVTEALRALRRDLERASELVAGTGGTDRSTTRDALDTALAETRQLRRALQRMAGEAQPGAAETATGEGFDGEPPAGSELERRVADVAGGIGGILRELRERGIDPGELDALRALTVALGDAQFSDTPELLDREARHALGLVEQLELALARSARRDPGEIRVGTETEIPEAYRDIVADYYRRLGAAGQDD